VANRFHAIVDFQRSGIYIIIIIAQVSSKCCTPNADSTTVIARAVANVVAISQIGRTVRSEENIYILMILIFNYGALR